MKKYLIIIGLVISLTSCLNSTKNIDTAKIQPTPAVSPVNPCQTNTNLKSDCDEVYDIDTQGYPYYPAGHPRHRPNSIRYYPVGHPLHDDKTMPKIRPTLNSSVKVTDDLPKIQVSRSNPSVMQETTRNASTTTTSDISRKSPSSSTSNPDSTTSKTSTSSTSTSSSSSDSTTYHPPSTSSSYPTSSSSTTSHPPSSSGSTSSRTTSVRRR